MELFVVYKIRNKINGKSYIGVHKTITPNDNYFGSGKAIKNAIKKYGKENFEKQLLFITYIEENAYSYEFYMTKYFNPKRSYNLKPGGVGGFTKENSYKGLLALCKKAGKKAVQMGYGFGGINRKDTYISAQKGGKANKGNPKSAKHIQAIKESWIRKKLLASSNGKTSSS